MCSCLLVIIDHKTVQDFYQIHDPFLSWLDIHQRRAVFSTDSLGKNLTNWPTHGNSSSLSFFRSLFLFIGVGRYETDKIHSLLSLFQPLFSINLVNTVKIDISPKQTIITNSSFSRPARRFVTALRIPSRRTRYSFTSGKDTQGFNVPAI